MLPTRVHGSTLLFIALTLIACSNPDGLADQRLRSAERDTANWLMYGRTYDDHRFSPLAEVNEQTIGKLGLVWTRELGTTRGLEATPLVDNGVIYTTTHGASSTRSTQRRARYVGPMTLRCRAQRPSSSAVTSSIAV